MKSTIKPIVAIVGRPNVGKSTLFNKILGSKKAIVLDEPGVTRDRNYADIEEAGRGFTLVDTGGFEADAEDVILAQVREETRLAIEEADVIILLLDGRSGPLGDDAELAAMLRRCGKPVIYAANKIDSKKQEDALGDFYSLGIPEVMPVSAEAGYGVNELIDAVVKVLPLKEEEVIEEEDRIQVAIVGRPNVGKSSLLNRLIGQKRALVSDIAGTTRDAVDTPFEKDGKKYLFIDTAGIRKKDKISRTVESYSVMEAIRSISKCDIAVLVIDATAGLTMQDEKIAGIIEDKKKACVIVVNKWDIAEKDDKTVDIMTKAIRQDWSFIDYAPVIFVSALTGQRAMKVFQTIDAVIEKTREKISTSRLNNFLAEFKTMQRPQSYMGREVKFYYITQVGTAPPAFMLFTNHPDGIKDNYKRFLINTIRASLGIDICPIRIIFKKRERE
ncbi:MAG: ribosome biogenesis GTPase Der [Deltaproteobacteria bacterium]|nr:ribosome biogenesis GTPase Der [Deltaproteobacteria bacterium]